MVWALALLLLALAGGAREAEAQACDRIRVQSFQGNVQLMGLYDFCNEYRRLQGEVMQLRQVVEQQQAQLLQVQQLRQMVAASMPVSEIVRGPDGAGREFTINQPGVLLATGYAAGEVKLSLDGRPCGAGDRNAVCQTPLAAGGHAVRATGSDVVLSIMVLIR
jgi:hypothetical protein